MTEDYKKSLLKYLTGKLKNEQGKNVPQFGEYKTSDNNTRKQIADELNINISDVRIRGSLSSDNYDTILLYGLNLNNEKTFIGIFNKKLELLQLLQTFESGSNLFSIVSMQIDEEGKIYGLSQNVESNNLVLRVLLFDNIFSSGVKTGNYSISLKKSYIVQATNNFKCSAFPPKDVIKKVPGEAIYYITGYGNDNTYTRVVKFQINVGSENTWNDYTIGTNVYYAQSRFTVNINKDDNTHYYYAYALDVINKKYVVYKINGEGNINRLVSIDVGANVWFPASQVLAINDTEIYLSIADGVNNSNTLYKVENNNLKTIEITDYYHAQDDTYYTSYYYLQNINNNVFITKYVPFRYGLQVYFGIIINDNIYYKNEGQESSIMVRYENFNFTTAYYDTYISSQYNLYQVYINSDLNNQVVEHTLNNLSFIYSKNNYNGLPYEAPNCLIPDSSIIYNADGDIIFARDLYNKTIFGATTTSTVEIPNTLLNDMIIDQCDLISETNMTLVNGQTSFIKNIYENVDVNFINTISIRNDNDINNKILNPTGASRLNNSVSSIIDYENAQATKIKINYLDNTYKIIELDTHSQIKMLSDYVLKYVFSIFVPKEIHNIQIISHDEKTVYQTIDGNNFELGKYYNINQYVSIDGNLVFNDVLYNGEQVKYNNEEVKYVN